MAPTALSSFLCCWVISVMGIAAALGVNDTSPLISYRIPAGAKKALCGYYTIAFQMWASSTTTFLYLTDTACDSYTATPCLQSTTAALLPISCADRVMCEGQTSQPSAVPLCLVLNNKDTQSPVDVNLLVSGSFSPVAGSGRGGSGSGGINTGGVSTLQIILISVGIAAGVIIAAGLTSLAVWLLCFKPPPRPQPPDSGHDFGAKSSATVATPTAPLTGPFGPQLLLSPAAVYPYPSYRGLQYGGTPYGARPGPPYVVVPPFSPSGGGVVRSPGSLAPLHAGAYSALSLQPPGSPPPVLVLPPLPLQRKAPAPMPAASAVAKSAVASPRPSPVQPTRLHETQQVAAPSPLPLPQQQ